MTRIQRITVKSNAARLRTVAKLMSEQALDCAATGAIGLAKACAHYAIKSATKARRLERKAKQSLTWAVMPPFVLKDFYDYSVAWFLDNPAAMLLAVSIVSAAVLVRIAAWRLAQKDALMQRKALRITSLEEARRDVRETVRRRAALLRSVAKQMERDGDRVA